MHVNDFVRSYFEAWNKLDPEGVAEHIAVNGVYRDMTTDVEQTRDELIINLKDYFSSFQHHYELIGEIQKSPDTIAFQYRMSFFRDKADPKPMARYHGAEFITMHGDSAVSIKDYYELPEIPDLRKYARSGLSDEQLSRYQQRLDLLMHSQNLYLNPELALPELASMVGCSVNHLSQVINAGFGSSFFDYVNLFRIRYAQNLMTENHPRHNAIVNIAFAVGFNSNSAFYAAFKKFAGETPGQYRRKLAASNKP